MILTLIRFFVHVLFAITVANGEMNDSTGVLRKLESLLISGDYHESQRYLDSMASSESAVDTAALNEYRAVVTRLLSVLTLPNSLSARYTLAGQTYWQRFLEIHAGVDAAACYDQYKTLLAEGKHTRAYERYLLADFLRRRHIASEKARLYENLALTRELVKRGEFDQAEEMSQMFEKEELTSTLLQLKKELEKEYSLLQHEIDEARRLSHYEASRVDLIKTISVSFGTGLDPFLSIPLNSLQFSHPPSSTGPFILTGGSAISKAVVDWSAEIGAFITPTLMIGVHYYSGNASAANAYMDMNRVIRKFRLRVEYKSTSIWLRYYLDNRTGIRAFFGFSAGSNHRKLFPEKIEEDPSSVVVEERKQTGARLAPAFGVEYVPPWPFPMVAAAEARGDFATGDTAVFPAFSLHVGLKAGVLF